MRGIAKSCFDAPSAPLFYEHNFPYLSNIYMLQIGLFVFSFKNKLLPVGFHGMFLSSSQLHFYNTRNAMNYRSQFSRANCRKFTIAFQGPNFWNTLPAELKDESSRNVFRKNLLRFLVQQAFVLIISILLINNLLYSLVLQLLCVCVIFLFSCLIFRLLTIIFFFLSY